MADDGTGRDGSPPDGPAHGHATHDTFTADWLALREPVDHRSRSAEVVELLATSAEREGWTRALDLGAGTGSNLRYLAPRLPSVTTWTLLDHDEQLLAQAAGEGDAIRGATVRAAAAGTTDPASRATVHARRGDLAEEGLAAVGEADIVVASALLDLVSERWLRALVDRCASLGRAALFALTYDGDIAWRDADPDDALVRDALNEHQVREKGLGPALGPRAPNVALELFEAAGFDTLLRPSPWLLAGAGDAPLTEALVDGWVEAAVEVRPKQGDRIRAWATRRRAAVRAGAFGVRVGHRDVLALPPARGVSTERRA